jgi:hypothetical protein
LNEGEHAGQPVDVERYRETGHLVLEGKLGSRSATVLITPYAQGRMRRRDIDGSEVLEALARPLSSHGRGKTEGRYEVAAMTERGRLRVIYERPTPEIVLVITTHQESD